MSRPMAAQMDRESRRQSRIKLRVLEGTDLRGRGGDSPSQLFRRKLIDHGVKGI